MRNIGLTDAPIKNLADESLGLSDYVEALSEFIRSCEMPITIACQGDWGTGKTSMMNMVCQNLSQGERRIETFWFNTWQFAQFQMQDEITLSLLSSFIDELHDSEVAKTLGKLTKFVGNVAGNVAKAAVDITTGGAGDMVKDAIDKVTPQDSVAVVRRLRGDIQKAVDGLLKKKNADRLVVFIDDLDRLVPERAVEILEIIKLFLDVPNCVFVLAVDYHVVSKGLEQKFGVSMSDLKGKSFFDKIIQLPFNLPIAQYDIRRYMATLFGSQFKFKEDDADLLVQLAENSIGANPRSLKRLFNTLQLLNIVASKKNMLDADAIATTEDRQRLLFAVLCLQLAYEPVYQILLKEEKQLSTEYLRKLADIENLQNGSIQFETVKKALTGRGELNEALPRFTDFMRALTDSAQLASDQSENADESLNPEEIDLLRGFLSLSALTNAAGVSSSMNLGTFRHKAAMLEHLEKKLKPKYQSSLAKINTTFKVGFQENYGEIGFYFRLGAFAFGLWTQWDDRNKSLTSYLWEVEGSEKSMVRDWFKSVENMFPALHFEHLRNKKYGFIETVSFDANQNPEVENRILNEYFSLLERTLDTAVPLLVKLYESRRDLIESAVAFTDKLSIRLAEEFPASDGWVIENLLRTLVKGANIKVYHSAWNNFFMICLEAPWEPFARNFVFGLKNTQWNMAYSDGVKEAILHTCETVLFPEDTHRENNEPWIYFQLVPESIRELCRGKFLDPNCRYAFDTPEQESQAIEQIVERFTRFKQILPELNGLAAAAKQP